MTAKDYRFQARQALQGNWAVAVGTTLVAVLLGGATSGGVNFEFEFSESHTIPMSPQQQEMLTEYLPLILGILGITLLVGIAVAIFLSGVVSVGYARFHLDMADGQVPEFKTLFSQFQNERYWNTVVMCFLHSLYVIGWMLLFIIPGIIASYSYAMTSYIMIDHPELTPAECLKVSKRMMEGNRWRLFCLNISFIGWQLLSGLTFGIGGLFLTPYQWSASAAFYRSICSNVSIEECL